jgi:hypothetical protein
MSAATFLVPSVMWHGAAPTAPDISSAEANSLLWQLDGVLLLLELAGYEASEVVIDVPPSDATGTDLLTGTTGPPGHDWAPAAAPGLVGIFVGPRTGLGPPGGAATVTLAPVDYGRTDPGTPGVSFGFGPTEAGWLTLPVLPDADLLYTGIAPAIEDLVGVLAAGIADAYPAAAPAPDGVPTPGLLSMLDPSTWNVASGSTLPDPKAWAQYGSTLVELGRTIRDLALSGVGIGLRTFLDQEASSIRAPSTLTGTPAPPDRAAMRRHSVLERLVEGAGLAPGTAPPLVDVQPGVWLAGMYAALKPDDQVSVTVAELDWLTWTRLLMILHSVGVVDFLSYRLKPDAGDLYGGRNLTLGDTGAEVGALQGDLRGLGFTMIDAAENDFGRTTDWAVREFQIYAKMPNTARWLRDTFPYADGLEQVSVPSDQLYAGDPTGLVDVRTRAAIAGWKRNNWRCPVVAEAWTMRGFDRDAVVAGLDNVWRYDEVPVGPRVYVRDFTGAYDLPAPRRPTDRHVVGRFKRFDNFGGPEAVPDGRPGNGHCWPEAEILAKVTGSPNPAGSALSMFRVVRLVAEVECYAHLDSINAYDRGVVSLGPCDWTFGLIPNVPPDRDRDMGAGELAGFLAYVDERYALTFESAVRRFGLQPVLTWASTGQPCANTLRTYGGQLARPDAAGQWMPLPSSAADHADTVAEMYRSWPWIYRWQMAGRTMPEWQAACWDFARVRFRDVLSTPWSSDIDHGGIKDPPGGPPVKIGDVFSSERAVAMVLRWHINRPADVITSSVIDGKRVYGAAAPLRRVYTDALALSSTMTPDGVLSDWTDDDEVLLLDAFDAVLPTADLKATMKRIRVWPTQTEKPFVYPKYYGLDPATLMPIGETRGSFLPDYDGLPPAPDFPSVGV